jgi:hypothetical protein
MEEKEDWVFYKDIDWDCKNFNRFNVDTRDFHCGYNKQDENHKDIKTISLDKNKPKFFHTKDELTKLLDRLFEESGGAGEWRMIQLKSKDSRVLNWRMKYIRIHRIDVDTFIICNSNGDVLNKELLSNEICQEYLCHQ